MTHSMRKQTYEAMVNKLKTRNVITKKKEEFRMLKLGPNIRSVKSQSSLGSGTVQKIRELCDHYWFIYDPQMLNELGKRSVRSSLVTR